MKGRSSQRVPNKNFRNLQGKPLCHWFLEEVAALPKEYDIYIDSEDESVFEKLGQNSFKRFQFHKRQEWFAGDEANGNHMIHQFALAQPGYDIYVQAYVTAVTLKRFVIEESMNIFLQQLDAHDSMYLVTEESGWIWFEGQAVNYDPAKPHGLKRSQDATYLKETTGLYAITRDAVLRTGCRIGETPLPHLVEKEYSLDIDTMSDLKEAEKILAAEGTTGT